MSFFQAVKSIAIFLICAQCVLHFRASKKYEKYIKLLIGVMVLVQLCIPLFQLFGGQTAGSMKSEMDELRQTMEKELAELYLDQIEAEEPIMQESLYEKPNVELTVKKEIYMQDVKSRINNIAVKYDFTVIDLECETSDLCSKLKIMMQDTSNVQDNSIHIGQIKMEFAEEPVAGKNEKLQLLSNEIAQMLGKKEEDVEVIVVG